jgi:ribosomal protein S20
MSEEADIARRRFVTAEQGDKAEAAEALSRAVKRLMDWALREIVPEEYRDKT